MNTPRTALEELKRAAADMHDSLTYPGFDIGVTERGEVEDLLAIIDEAGKALSDALEPEVVAYQFQDRDGTWWNFLSKTHCQDTIPDGSWPIRRLILHPDDITPPPTSANGSGE